MKIITRRDYSREDLIDKENKIDKVEKAILEYQESLWEGYICVDDNTYNACVEYLEQVNPYSDIIRNEVKIKHFYDIDEDLRGCLIEIISEESDDIYFMLNPQGMNVKLYYNQGVLEKAETYGRALGSVDVTESLKRIIGEKNDLIDKEGNVVLIGTIVLPSINIDAAKELCNAQDTYSGVFSVIKAIESIENMEDVDSYTDDYTDLLMFVCTDVQIEGLPLINIETKINYIKEYGIETAPVLKLARESADILTVEDAVYTFETLYGDIDYKTDGIRILPSDVKDKSIYLLKDKKWGRTVITANVTDIKWVQRVDGYKPIIYLDREIEFKDNETIGEIELDEIIHLLLMNIEIGKPITFLYTTELGIILISDQSVLVI